MTVMHFHRLRAHAGEFEEAGCDRGMAEAWEISTSGMGSATQPHSCLTSLRTTQIPGP